MPEPRRRSIFTARLVNTTPEGAAPRVIDDLRTAILSGAEPPGTLIPLDAVAAFFGVSQIPVREALKVLCGEGLISHVPHMGYRVTKLTFTEFRELYEVRQALETSALREAVRHATDMDDDLVHATHAAMGAAVTDGDEKAYHAESRRFHRALIEPAGMRRLLHMYEGAWNITEPARPMAHVERGRRELFHDDHDRMLEAFIARDADRLVRESTAHYDHLKTAIEAFRDDPDVFDQGT